MTLLSQTFPLSLHSTSTLYPLLPQIKPLPDSDDLAGIKVDSIHLGDKDGGNSFIEGGTIHIHRGSHRQHKAGDALVNTVVLLQTTERDRQGGSTGGTEGIDEYINESINQWCFKP